MWFCAQRYHKRSTESLFFELFSQKWTFVNKTWTSVNKLFWSRWKTSLILLRQISKKHHHETKSHTSGLCFCSSLPRRLLSALFFIPSRLHTIFCVQPQMPTRASTLSPTTRCSPSVQASSPTSASATSSSTWSLKAASCCAKAWNTDNLFLITAFYKKQVSSSQNFFIIPFPSFPRLFSKQ